MSVRAPIFHATSVVIAFALAVPAISVAQTPSSPAPMASQAPPTTSGAAEDQGYVLGPEDVVEVEVLGRSDFRTRARIGADGKIQLPYLGDVEAANRTARELGEQIGRALSAAGYFTDPVMRVEIVGYASRYATVLGAVANPGLIPINRAYRLSEIIARVGGVKPDGADYIVIRPENGEERRVAIAKMAMGGPEDDPEIAPGDKVFVPPAQLFYVSGQVNSPGAYPISSDMTIRMAIARSGGLTAMGSDRRVKISRGGEELKRVDLDSKLQPGDIITVGERLF